MLTGDYFNDKCRTIKVSPIYLLWWLQYCSKLVTIAEKI